MGDFTVTFNVGAGSSKGKYESFIKDLRNKLGVGYYRDVPILPRQEERPTMWFDILLQTDNHSTRFRFRRDNVYLVAYQMEGSTEWLEFTDENRRPHQLIAGSSSLRFSGSYTGLGTAGGRGLEQVQLGRADLARAVDNLATTRDGRDRARSLMVVIAMLSEAIRFKTIQGFVYTNYYNSASLTPQMRAQVNDWGDLSERLLVAHHRPGHRFSIPPNDMGVNNIEDAFDVTGTLKDCGFTSPRLAAIAMMPNLNDDDHSGVQPLVEVYSVRINYTDGYELYGTIKVSDGLRKSIFIYNRGSDDRESVGQGEYCTLTGPQNLCISATDDFTVDLDLWAYHIFADHQVSRGQISWNVYDTAANKYNTLLSTNVGGGINGGSATVNYKVLRSALQATVEVVFMNTGGGASYAWVYGIIKCTDGHSADERILFKREWSKYAEVKCGDQIPLLRCVMAVPSNDSLIVAATLNDYNRFSSDYEVANGSQDFTAKHSGNDVKYINGRNGNIRVKVAWNDM